jgi:hypothetical protein
MSLDPSGRYLLATFSLMNPQGPTAALRVARIDLSTRAVAVLDIPFENGGMGTYTGLITAW